MLEVRPRLAPVTPPLAGVTAVTGAVTPPLAGVTAVAGAVKPPLAGVATWKKIGGGGALLGRCTRASAAHGLMLIF